MVGMMLGGISLSRITKSDHGFAHSVTGQMLIPIEYLPDYNKNPLT